MTGTHDENQLREQEAHQETTAPAKLMDRTLDLMVNVIESRLNHAHCEVEGPGACAIEATLELSNICHTLQSRFQGCVVTRPLPLRAAPSKLVFAR